MPSWYLEPVVQVSVSEISASGSAQVSVGYEA